MTKRITKVLVANRGEIAIRVFRACSELNIRTVAIYSRDDSASFHRYKADEAYLVGEGKKPIDAYLDIDGIIEIAKERSVDAIHPGYGFMSENIHFAKSCEEEGIIYIGPKIEHLDMFGDKAKARKQAEFAQIPVIPGSDGPIKDWQEAKAFGEAAKETSVEVRGAGKSQCINIKMSDLHSRIKKAIIQPDSCLDMDSGFLILLEP